MLAAVAGPPSPELAAFPLPATVEMIPLVEILRIRLFSVSQKNRLLAESKAMQPIGPNEAAAAGPPSPPKAGDPVPANVVIVPSVATRRMRLLKLSPMYKFPLLSTAAEDAPFSEALVASPSPV